MAWDVMSGVTKTACDVMSRVTKTAWDVLSGWQIFVGCFVWGVKKWHGMFCPGMFCPAPIVATLTSLLTMDLIKGLMMHINGQEQCT